MIGAVKTKYIEGISLILDSYMHLVGKGTLIYNSYRAGILSSIPALLPFPRELTLNQIRWHFSSMNFLNLSETYITDEGL